MKKLFDAKRATKRSSKYKEARTFSTILNHIENMAECGFICVETTIENNSKADGIYNRLISLGFIVRLERLGDCIDVTISW